MECNCDCHECDDCNSDCYDCNCECHDCCEDCDDSDSDEEDDGPTYQPPLNKVERVTERIQTALGVKLSIEETGPIDGAGLQAAAYPDKTIKITRELSNVMTDDELAFIIGHEYAHIEQEHISKQNAANAAKREAFVQAMNELDERQKRRGSGKFKRVATQVVGGVLGGASLAVTSQLESQNYETKADERALEVVEAAGYNPEASVTAYEKLHGGRVPDIGVLHSIVSTHPPPKSRHNHLREKSRRRRDNG
jgi:Zn-dependent protease with chaperone function